LLSSGKKSFALHVEHASAAIIVQTALKYFQSAVSYQNENV
jgi:hypothetical protein